MATNTASAEFIQLDSVGRVFLTQELESHALSDINLTINSGDFVAISGPSGCGKTTLLSILGFLDRPTSGSYRLKGKSLSNLSRSSCARMRNREIGFVFQAFNLIGNLSVRENVELPLTYRGLTTRIRQQRVDEILERTGMHHRKSHFPSQLSGGQQQRVAVARALVGNPSILLADEPTGNLDSTNAESIMNLLSELNSQGTTICIVTHEARFAQHAHRVVQLFDGRMKSDGTEVRS
jgi:putative ABC transport system ATP-binding protein